MGTDCHILGKGIIARTRLWLPAWICNSETPCHEGLGWYPPKPWLPTLACPLTQRKTESQIPRSRWMRGEGGACATNGGHCCTEPQTAPDGSSWGEGQPRADQMWLDVAYFRNHHSTQVRDPGFREQIGSVFLGADRVRHSGRRSLKQMQL